MKITTEQEWKQAAFNGAFRGLRHQGFQRALARKDLADRCVYRAGGNRDARVCCAVGWLIPDDRWVPELNSGIVVSHPVVRNMVTPLLQPLTDKRAAWLRALQGIHDGNDVPSLMERELRQFAAKHNLTIPDEQ